MKIKVLIIYNSYWPLLVFIFTTQAHSRKMFFLALSSDQCWPIKFQTYTQFGFAELFTESALCEQIVQKGSSFYILVCVCI